MAKEVKSAPTKPEGEKLIPAMVGFSFSDGNLAEHFAKYGYACEWPAREVRYLPAWLILRVQGSGGQVEFVRE